MGKFTLGFMLGAVASPAAILVVVGNLEKVHEGLAKTTEFIGNAVEAQESRKPTNNSEPPTPSVLSDDELERIHDVSTEPPAA